MTADRQIRVEPDTHAKLSADASANSRTIGQELSAIMDERARTFEAEADRMRVERQAAYAKKVGG